MSRDVCTFPALESMQMKTKIKRWTATLLGCLVASPALVTAADVATDKMTQPMPKQMAEYTRTDETRNCLGLPRIDRSDVWDDGHILFTMRNGDLWLNTLPRQCSRLGREASFMYENAINQLCKMDIITVLDTSTNIKGPSCSLGDFQKIELKHKTNE